MIAESLDYPCAERLQPNLVWMAKHPELHGELKLSAEVPQKLARISVSTSDEYLVQSVRKITEWLTVKNARESQTSCEKRYLCGAMLGMSLSQAIWKSI